MVWDELNKASQTAFDAGDYLEAERLLNLAVVEAQKDPAKLGATLYRLGKVHLHLEDYERAESVLTRALAISGKALGLEHPEVARIIDQLGNANANQGKFAEAEPLLNRGLEMRRKLLGDQHAEVAESLISLGALHTRQRNFGQAELCLRDALEMQQKLLGADDVAIAETLGLMAMLYYKQNVFAEAARYAEKAIEIRNNALGANHPDVAMSLHILAMAAAAQKEYDQALVLYDRVLTIRQHYYPREHSLITSVVRAIGMIYLRTRNFAQAQSVFEDLERIAEAGNKTSEMIFAMKQIGWLFVMQRNFDSGQVYIARALRRLQNMDSTADRARDNLTMSLFCCHIGLKDYLSAAKALPATARVLAKNRMTDKQLFKHGIKTGLYAGRRG